MRKIIVNSMISLDGVMQGPGGPEEDTEGGFEYGGWTAPYFDEESGKAMEKQLEPADLLLGRKTFEIWENYWPEHADNWPGINDVTKYVLSSTMEKSGWENSVFLKSLVDIEKLKNSTGGGIKVWGSGELIQLLLKHDLVDELWVLRPAMGLYTQEWEIYPLHSLVSGECELLMGVPPISPEGWR